MRHQAWTNQRKRMAGLILAALILLVPLTALAIKAPGLQYTHEFRPELIEFPERINESDPALYQAHKSLLRYPAELAALEKSLDDSIQSVVTEPLDALNKQARIDTAHRDFQTKLAALNSELAELRKAFLFLVRESLKNDGDPYVLLFMAQELYGLRGQPPALIETATAPIEKPADAPADEATPEAASEASAEASAEAPTDTKADVKAEPEPVQTPKPSGTPSVTVQREFKSNYEIILAATEEIRTRFPEFEYMDRVIRLMAVCKMELGMTEDALYLYKELIKDYPNSRYLGDTYFRLAEFEFETPTSYDHFTTAVNYYDLAFKYYQPGKTYYRILYKKAWAQYLSPDMNEDALSTFVKLYKAMDAAKMKSEEMEMIKIEILEVVRQIKARENKAQGSAFGR